MSSYKTSSQIVAIIYDLLKAALSVEIHALEKDTASTVREYIVINSLPVDAEVMQICHVNVNYHVEDIADGVPDIAKIQAGEAAVIAALDGVTASTYMIDFEGQELFKEIGLREHFSNIKFSFKNINY